MKNKKLLIISIILIVLIFSVSNIIVTVQIKRTLQTLLSENEQYKNYYNLQIENIKLDIQKLSDNQNENILKIQNDLDAIKKKSENQFNKTVDIKKTYDAILTEQKKRTLDTTSQETAIMNIKKEAEQHYIKKQYALAYKDLQKVILYINDDIEIRLMKMKCLYYMNPADTSKYKEILEDIRILKLNGYYDSETEIIENQINFEKEGVNE